VSGQSALAQESVVINEIIQNPALASDSNGEWFELYNPTGSGIDIDGWTIRDDDFDTHVISNGGPLVVPAGGFLVIGKNSNLINNGGVAIDYVFSSHFLSNGSDELVLIDLTSTEVDRVAWDDGATFPDPNGASMSLIDPTLDNSVGGNWCTATTPFGDGDKGTPGAVNDCAPIEPEFGECGDPAILISAVQGNGFASSMAGLPGVGIEIEGVVVGDFQSSGSVVQLGGFFLQEEDSEQDGDSSTSEGIFVFQGGTTMDVAEGDVVRVKGDVSEFGGLTELSNVSNLAVCSQGNAVTPTTVSLPVGTTAEFEQVEGMLVNIPQTLYVTGHFNLGRFGEVELSADMPLDNPTNVTMPGPSAIALRDINNLSRIQLDDGTSIQNPMPLPPYIGEGNTLRTGDTVAGLTAVFSEAFGDYELQPLGSINFKRVNTRTGPPDVGGIVRVASFNVLNYFTTLDDDIGTLCGPLALQGCRGADTPTEFALQRAKLVEAITKMNAHVVGLIELENDPAEVALADLVNGLNDATAAGTYDYIATGPIGSDVIRVALIYQPAVVTPFTPFAILDSSVDLDPSVDTEPSFNDDLNRPVLAQSFAENTSGVVFTVAVNHFKSKGSDCDDFGDPDTGDGQGNCNGERTKAANALAAWLAMDPTASGSDDVLIIGDLNAYAQEDPINMLEMAGYTDLIEMFVGAGYANGAYSFNFDGESGYLDHALSSPGMTANVAGAAIWHINFNQPALQNPDEFRSSDHDPVLVGLYGDRDNDGVPDGVDPHPDSDPRPTVVVNDCDSGVSNDHLGNGSNIGDLVNDAFADGGKKAVKRLVW
jgi:predicted extracellular nuclease